MSKDIRPILSDWDYEPDEVTVRLIVGDDGVERIQMRLDLGLMQLELHGRPDGKTIQGAESWLAIHESRQKEHDTANPDGAPYQLTTEDCAELMREGVQYYHRYVSFWRLKRYELCARDTERNLRLFRFVMAHAKYDRDKLQFDQWRPYVTMMHAKAVATPLVELRQWDAALGAIDAGIRALERFLSDYGQEEQAERIGEFIFLRRWRKEILELSGKKDDAEDAQIDPIVEIREKLEVAVNEERYEDAASLRDELARLEDPPPPGSAAGPPV